MRIYDENGNGSLDILEVQKLIKHVVWWEANARTMGGDMININVPEKPGLKSRVRNNLPCPIPELVRNLAPTQRFKRTQEDRKQFRNRSICNQLTRVL